MAFIGAKSTPSKFSSIFSRNPTQAAQLTCPARLNHSQRQSSHALPKPSNIDARRLSISEIRAHTTPPCQPQSHSTCFASMTRTRRILPFATEASQLLDDAASTPANLQSSSSHPFAPVNDVANHVFYIRYRLPRESMSVRTSLDPCSPKRRSQTVL